MKRVFAMKFSELDTTVQETLLICWTIILPLLPIFWSKTVVWFLCLWFPNQISLSACNQEMALWMLTRRIPLSLESWKTKPLHMLCFLTVHESDWRQAVRPMPWKHIFLQKNGIEVSFYTPFAVKGLFKKTINVEKSILAEIKENVFDWCLYHN